MTRQGGYYKVYKSLNRVVSIRYRLHTTKKTIFLLCSVSSLYLMKTILLKTFVHLVPGVLCVGECIFLVLFHFVSRNSSLHFFVILFCPPNPTNCHS